MAGTVLDITGNPSNITGMTCLEERPVFFLKLNGSLLNNLVVKGEGTGEVALDDHAETSIKWGAKLMKNVNNTEVNTKIMTAAEVLAFKTAGLLLIPPNMARPRLNLAIPGPPYTWTKMPYVDGVSTAEFWSDDKGAYEATPAKKHISKMSDDAFWTDLGKVVAVDIFNGNCDRFDVTTGNWQNKGNVMFMAAGPTKVIGLDTFDPNAAGLSDLRSPLDFTNIQTRIMFQHLLLLTDSGERLKFSRACVKSVGEWLKKAFAGKTSITVPVQGPQGPGLLRIEVAQMATLFADYAPVFDQGIAAGATQLKANLQGKVRQYAPVRPPLRPGGHRGYQPPQPVPVPGKTIPQGILDRMAYLKWMPI